MAYGTFREHATPPFHGGKIGKEISIYACTADNFNVAHFK
jgi:hypothetical protein